jgi:hypothetical protein
MILTRAQAALAALVLTLAGCSSSTEPPTGREAADAPAATPAVIS